MPAHSTSAFEPRSFSTFNKQVAFESSQFDEIDAVMAKIREMKRSGYHIYDSDQYIDDLQRFVKNEPITWRNRNGGVCDAGSLYFAVLPDGSLAPCCDWRLDEDVFVNSSSFVSEYQQGFFKNPIKKKSEVCSGCLYGSYPEISISARFAKAALERAKLFIVESRAEIRNLTPAQLTDLAKKISESGSNAS